MRKPGSDPMPTGGRAAHWFSSPVGAGGSAASYRAPSFLQSSAVCGLGLVRGGGIWNWGLKLAGLNSGDPHQASALCEVSLSDAPWVE